MASDFNTADHQRLSKPRIHLLRMAVFLILVGFLGLILYKPIQTAFYANPGLNGLILGVLAIGILLAIRQVWRLFREVRWVNSLQPGGVNILITDPPVLLAPMAAVLGDKAGHSAISTMTLRSVLDSVGMRLDESRDILRYLAGVLVFLGLLGTFWGLLETVSSVGKVIQSMGGSGDSAALFDELKAGLATPLGGMGISFSSSLFGLAGSLIIGFLDLQAGQAQNRFYMQLEDWLSTTVFDPVAEPSATGAAPELRGALERLSAAVGEGGSSRAATNAIVHLAEGIQGLVQHMRSEQQMIRDWVEAQAAQQAQIKKLLEKLANEKVVERQE